MVGRKVLRVMRFICLSVVALLVVMAAAPAEATTATITYKITRDSDPDSHFSWAWIHGASGFVDDFVDRH